jgi:hypothetical protein
MDFREIGWGGMEWIDLAQGRDWWRALVNAVMNLWVQGAAGLVNTIFVTVKYGIFTVY